MKSMEHEDCLSLSSNSNVGIVFGRDSSSGRACIRRSGYLLRPGISRLKVKAA